MKLSRVREEYPDVYEAMIEVIVETQKRASIEEIEGYIAEEQENGSTWTQRNARDGF